ncbi:MAG TPA: hypothetical protein VF796_17260, partial [Humisphaera sp.]
VAERECRSAQRHAEHVPDLCLLRHLLSSPGYGRGPGRGQPAAGGPAGLRVACRQFRFTSVGFVSAALVQDMNLTVAVPASRFTD